MMNIILKGLSFNFYIMKKLPPKIDTFAIVSINLPESLGEVLEVFRPLNVYAVLNTI